MKQRILVTGSTGYIGQHLIDRLVSQPGTEVFGLGQRNDGRLPEERFLEGDLLSSNLLHWFEQIRPDILFHAVSLSQKSPFERRLLVHVDGTRRLLQALVDNGLRTRVIVVGSADEYGFQDEPIEESALCMPEDEVGIALLAQTQVAQMFARRYNLPVMIARLFSVYGQTGRNLTVASLASQIARAEATAPEESDVYVQNLRRWMDFIHVDDVVDALLALSQLSGQNETSGQIYNVGSGESTAISTLLDLLLEHTHLDAEALKSVQLKVQGAQKEDISWASIHKIRQHTGWEPKIALKDGLKQELDYWRKHITPITAGAL